MKIFQFEIDKEKIQTIYMYIYCFLVIFLCRDSLISTTVIGFTKAFILTILLSIPNGVVFIKKIRRKEIPRNLIYIFVILVIGIFLSVIIKWDFQLYNLSLLVFIFIGFIAASAYEYKKFIKVFIDVMTFVCAYSLVAMYIFKPIIMSNNIDYPTIVNSVNNIFYNFGIAFVLKSEYYIRNFSFFREPGVYQTFIVLALVFLLFCKNLEENKIKKIGSSLLFIITIVSTFSTTGIVILTMILTTYIVKIIEEKKMNKKTFIILVGCGMIALIILSILYYNLPNFKRTLDASIEKIFTDNDSVNARKESIIKPLQLYLESPIIGHTFLKTVEIVEHNTNTTINMFNIYGVVVGVLHVMLIYLTIKKLNVKRITRILLLISLLININTQFLIGNVMLWIVLFSYYMEEKELCMDNKVTQEERGLK